MKYADKLRDPRWQKKRLEIFERDGWYCVYCMYNTSMLSVHHIFYNKKDPWDHDNDAMVTVCEECHKMESDFEINRGFNKASIPEKLFHVIQKHLRVGSESMEFLIETLMKADVEPQETGEAMYDGIARMGRSYKKQIQKNIQETINNG